MQLDLNQLRELLAALDQTDISELKLKSGDFELTVRKGTQLFERVLPATEPTSASGVAGLAPAVYATSSPATPVSATSTGTDSPIKEPPQVSADTAAAPPATVSSPPNDKKWIDVISPMVGTFYSAPAPDEPPFVEVGDRIRVGQTVCIIEAMKLMNEIEAEVSGVVMEISGRNGEPVEYGQALMRINPD